MQTQLQLGRSSAAGCSLSRSHAQPRRVAACSSRVQRQPLLVHSKFSNPFDGMFGGGKGGDSDAARRAIEVGQSYSRIWFCLKLVMGQHNLSPEGVVVETGSWGNL
jgi:hypothetical protein